MKHFIIDVNYLIPAERLGKITVAHRAFLQIGLQQGKLLFCGPKVPRLGGIIVARAESATELEAFFQDDPYLVEHVATYHFIEFNPIFQQDILSEWVSGKPFLKDPVGPQFMENTYYRNLPLSAEDLEIPQPGLEIPPAKDLPVIDLPAPAGIKTPALNLRQAIEERRSVRNYSTQPIKLEELSILLWLTQGVKKVSKRPVTLRTVPSAGARHAFETYLAINRVEGLPNGLYRYLAIENQLQEINRDPDLMSKLAAACLEQQQIMNSAVTFVWVAIRERMVWRYGERGYRYLHLDAGHVCQNLYLAAETVHCGVCAIAAFDDETVNQLLVLDGREQFAIYIASLGLKK